MKRNKLTVEDLLMMESASINIKEAAAVLGWGYRTVLEMAKNDSFPYEKCIVRIGDNDGEKNRFIVMRIKLISFITGETYEEQLQHKKKLLEEKNEKKQESDNNMRFTEEEKFKIEKIISSMRVE